MTLPAPDRAELAAQLLATLDEAEGDVEAACAQRELREAIAWYRERSAS